jgi:hypothetical protein
MQKDANNEHTGHDTAQAPKLVSLITSRHGPRRKHSSSIVVVQLLYY